MSISKIDTSFSKDKSINEREDFFKNILSVDISKPTSAFGYYLKEKHIKKENENEKYLDLGEYLRKSKMEYSKLSKLEMDKYINIANKEKIRYVLNMILVKKYILNTSILNKNLTAFTYFKDFFIYEYIKQNQSSLVDASENAKLDWRSLSKEEKYEWRCQLEKEKECVLKLKDFNPRHKPKIAIVYYIDEMIKKENMTKNEAIKKWSSLNIKGKLKYEKMAIEQSNEYEKLKDLYEIINGIKPKHPTQPFGIFMSEISKNQMTNNEDNLKEKEKLFNLKEMHIRYKNLTNEEKLRYIEKYHILKIKYIIKKREYSKKEFKVYKNKSISHSKIKSRIKFQYKRMSAYNLYVSEKMHDKEYLKGLFPGEIIKKLSQQWVNESDEVKREYKNKVNLEMKEYLVDKPIKPLSAYNIYVREFIKLNKDKLKSEELLKKAAESWMKETSDKKNQLEEEYISNITEYYDNYQEYNTSLENVINSLKSKTVSKIRREIQGSYVQNEKKRIEVSRSNIKNRSQI